MNEASLLPCQQEMVRQIKLIEGRMQEMNQNNMKGQMVDRPGSGKSYAMLEAIKSDTSNQQKKLNIIVCPFTILKQWIDYIDNYNLKYYILQYNDTQNFKSEDYDGFDIILIQDIVFRYFALNVDKNLTDDQNNTVFKIKNNVFRRIIIDEYDSIQFCIGDYFKQVKSDFVWFISATLNLSKNFSTTEFHGKVQCSEQLINQSFNSLPIVNYIDYLVSSDIINTIFESNQLQEHVSNQIACLEYQYFQKKYSVNLVSVSDMCKYFTINLFEELQKSQVSVMYEIHRAMKPGLSLYQFNMKLQTYIQEQEGGVIRDIKYIKQLNQFLQDIIQLSNNCNQEIQQAIKQKKFPKKDVNDLQFFDLECIQQQLFDLQKQTQIVDNIIIRLQEDHCQNCYQQYNDYCNTKSRLTCCNNDVCLQCVIELSKKNRDVLEKDQIQNYQCPICLKQNKQMMDQDNKALLDLLKTKNKDQKTQQFFYKNFNNFKKEKGQQIQKQISQQLKNQIFSKQNKKGSIQFQNITKQQVVKGIIDNIYNYNSRILIFCDYQSPFQDLSNYFQQIGIPYQYISGTDIEVQKIVQDFEIGDYKILLIDSLHFGVGLNLQISSDIIIMNDSTRFYQIVGRAQRMGRKSKLNVHKVYYNNEYQNLSVNTSINQTKNQQNTL